MIGNLSCVYGLQKNLRESYLAKKGRLVMALKPKKLLGLKYSIFQDIIKGNEELHVQKARLIPFYKPDDSKHFHSLRHTYAVRKLIQGVSIYTLKLLMGHKSVTTTEVYSEMNFKRVAQDFPTLVQNYPKKVKSIDGDTLLGDTISLPMTYI